MGVKKTKTTEGKEEMKKAGQKTEQKTLVWSRSEPRSRKARYMSLQSCG